MKNLVKNYSVKNAEEFRSRAREAFTLGLNANDIDWSGGNEIQSSLFGEVSSIDLTPRRVRQLTVPPSYFRLLEQVEPHRDSQKWFHLYSLLLKIQKQGAHILSIDIDDDVRALHLMQKQIKRDIHKMHAFVRFRKSVFRDREMFVAWHEPDHLILKGALPFFQRRFAEMEWMIATPEGLGYWDRQTLKIEERALLAEDFQGSDAFEEYWLTYFSSIFNPARIKIRAMKKEMPVRFWKNLPETAVYKKLLLEAPDRVRLMHHSLRKIDKNDATDFLPTEVEWSSSEEKIAALKQAALGCRGCPLHEHATQTVFGEGSAGAKMMIVGEQPGNDEDLSGHPFVGPAGQILEQVLLQVGLPRDAVYITNAVKHFHFERREKIRLHKRPTVSHIRACKAWLRREIEVVRPRIIVCLGATAAQAVIGYQVNVSRERGRMQRTTFCEQTLVTFHPSYLLRLPDPQENAEATKLFTSDLKMAAEFLKKDLSVELRNP